MCTSPSPLTLADEGRRAAHKAAQEKSHALRDAARKVAIEAGQLEAFERNLTLAREREVFEKAEKAKARKAAKQKRRLG